MGSGRYDAYGEAALKLAGNEPDAVKAREHYSTNVEAYNAIVKQAIESVRAPQ